MLEGLISLDELKVAVRAMKNHKCPEMYCELILNVMGEFHISAISSLTIEKIGTDPLLLKNWHPSSLLNLDNTILGKVIANRLQLIPPEVFTRRLHQR